TARHRASCRIRASLATACRRALEVDNSACPGGETGRRKGLKIPRGRPRAGSSPAPGTTRSAHATTMEKLYITAQEPPDDSFELAARVLQSGFRPNFIIGIWRGGTPVGIAVQELMDYVGVTTDHIAIRTSSYTGIGAQSDEVLVHGLGYIVRNINREDALL